MKHITILTLLLCCSCTTKKVVTDTQTSDTVRQERQEKQADTLTVVRQSETKVLNISAVEIVTETTIYDTEHTDSTGTSPIKEKRKTWAKLQSSTLTQDTDTTEAQFTSSVSISEHTDSIATSEAHTEEKRHPGFPLPNIIAFVAIVGIGVFFFRLFNR